jgi:nucleoside-diphosphate-sugar epimerase
LVTGGSGRLAEFVAKALCDDHEVVLFSRSQPPEDRANLQWIQGDLNVYEDCERALQGVEVIQHLGALPWATDSPSGRQSRIDRGLPLPPFDATMTTNIIGAYYLLTAAVKAGVKTVVMAGSNCAFGHCGHQGEFPFKYLPLDEEHPSEVMNSYSYTKLVGEELCAWYTRAYGIRTYVTRPAWIRPPDALEEHAKTMQPATEWSGGFWGYVASEDMGSLHRTIQDKADELPMHDVFVGNAADALALEPSLELIDKFRPNLLPLVREMSGHQAFFSTAKATRMLGWAPKHSWRDYL